MIFNGSTLVQITKLTRFINPITYGILTFRQLRGGEGRLFGPDPENKVTVDGLI